MNLEHGTLLLPKWSKRGKIFAPEKGSFFQTHATRPIPFILNSSRLRIFFASRCQNDSMHATYIDVDPSNPSIILKVPESPMFSLGTPGTFDDGGICPVSIQLVGDKHLLYYAGLKRRRLAGFETSIGVAELTHDLTGCTRLFEGPLIGQDKSHPILTAAPFVLRENGIYRMW